MAPFAQRCRVEVAEFDAGTGILSWTGTACEQGDRLRPVAHRSATHSADTQAYRTMRLRFAKLADAD